MVETEKIKNELNSILSKKPNPLGEGYHRKKQVWGWEDVGSEESFICLNSYGQCGKAKVIIVQMAVDMDGEVLFEGLVDGKFSFDAVEQKYLEVVEAFRAKRRANAAV